MATTYINSAKRTQLIDEYMDCWFDTCSYSSEDYAESEAVYVRQQLESMNNSELVNLISSTGWGIS